jgi:hypothetical protein
MIIQRTVFVGMTSLSALSNVSYAGMRAQNKPENNFARIATFVFGAPYSFITFFFVEEGSKNAYVIDLPTNDDSNSKKISRVIKRRDYYYCLFLYTIVFF